VGHAGRRPPWRVRSERRLVQDWIVDATKPGAAPVLLFDRSAEDRYSDPGFPITRMTATGDVAIQRTGDWIYLSGTGASPQGDRPFLDRLNLITRKRSGCGAPTRSTTNRDRVARRRRERVSSPGVSPAPSRPITSCARGPSCGRSPLSRIPPAAHRDPEAAPHIRARRRSATFGHALLPPGYTPGPGSQSYVAYPTEFASASAAGQVSARQPLQHHPRAVTPVLPDARLRRARRPEDADHRR